MKKNLSIVIMTILILMLCGCSGANTSVGTRNELVKDYSFDFEEELIEYISDHFDSKGSYSLGNGIKALDLDKKTGGELHIFPVYSADELIFLIIYGDETTYITDPEILNSINENDEYLIIKTDNSIYYVSKEQMLLIDGEEKELSNRMSNRINEIRNGTIERNLMGVEKRAIRIASEPDRQPIINEAKYYNDRIVVRLTSDNIENKVRMYEAFCHGRVEETVPDGSTYVFCFEPIDSENLRILLDASNGLSYVLEASLVERTESNTEEVDTTSTVIETELSE